MESFSALLALCAGTSPVTGKFPLKRSFDVFFDLRLNKWLSKQSTRSWFDTPSCSLWRHCNGKPVVHKANMLISAIQPLPVRLHRPHLYPLCPIDAIWWHRSESILAQVIAWCRHDTKSLAEPTLSSHYSEVLWHSQESNFAISAQP